MKDEFNNEAPYDFKNIKFNAFTGTEVVEEKIVPKYTSETYYTFSSLYSPIEPTTDLSLNGYTNQVYANKIEPAYQTTADATTVQVLNNIVFNNAAECFANSFGVDCHDMTFGNKAHDNKFGTNCYNNTFKNNCNSNTFGDSFYNNTADAYFESNFFSNKCHDNAFGKYVRNNTFGDLFVSNEIDDSFRFNTFGSNCNNNKVGSSTGQETYVQYNTFNSGTQNMKILSGLVFQYNIVTNYIPYTYDPNDFPDGIINKIVRNGEIL
ncbi:MAG: hypothetical protein HUJ52_01290 [Malacoplasma sp.]|nr:hypothetical protein [Malacoplasma sp.]